jgi:hypothetical protein
MLSFVKFNWRYLMLTILLLIVEVLIAKYVHDHIIRPYVGDVLVVILIYCFVKSFLKTPILPTAICVLLFAFAIKGLQYINIVKILGFQHSKPASIIIGNYFSWIDLLTYIIGITVVIIVEKIIRNKNLTEK